MTTVEQKFLLRSEFFDLMKTVGAPERTLTLKQVLAYLKDYITSRRLYDPRNPQEIHVADDPLGGVFGTSLFTVHEVIKLLRLQMFRILPNGIPQDRAASPVPSSGAINGDISSRVAAGEKRNFESVVSPVAGTSNENVKRQRHSDAPNASPMVLQVPPSPVLLSGNETDLSLQGYETEYVKNSSDDLWFLDSENESVDGDTFDIEYEVESTVSDDDNGTDTDSEIEDVVCAALFLCKDDSDVPFWGDKSDDEGLDDTSDDPELEEADKWTCNKCGSANKPTNPFCLKCWDQRVGWLPNRSERHPPKRRNRKLIRNLSDPGYQSSSQSTISNSQEEKEETSQVSQENQCPLCLVRAKTAVIIHGKTGHQVCCYKCARKLQSSNKRCPLCRRTIQRVVRNFVA